MPNLHPKTLAALAEGPQAVPIGADGVGVETSTMFARRIALIAMEEEREACAKVCDVEHRRDDLTGDYRYGAGICAYAIRRRGKP